jgi:O-antigen/teichoic acid export membrane protein
MDVMSNGAAAAIAVALALAGAGYWSLLAFPAIGAALTLAGSWLRVGWIPGLPRRAHDLGGALRFGGNLSGFNLVNYLARNADDALVGWRWGATALGHYGRAYALLLLPLRQVHGPVSAVALPMLGRLQDDAVGFARAYVLYITLLTRLTLPLIVTMIVLSDAVVLTILGDQWLPVAELFRILGFVGLVQALTNPLGSLLMATGRTDRLFRLALANTPLTLAAFAIGLPHGPRGVAIAYTVYNLLVLLPTLWYVCHGSPVRPQEILRAGARSLLVALPVGAVAAAAAAGLTAAPPPVRLLLALAAAGGSWLLLHRTPPFRAGNPLMLLRELRT